LTTSWQERLWRTEWLRETIQGHDATALSTSSTPLPGVCGGFIDGPALRFLRSRQTTPNRKAGSASKARWSVSSRAVIAAACGAILLALALYVQERGLYPRFFTLQWREEVLQHDGTTIYLRVVNQFERVRPSWRRSPASGVVQRSKEVAFERSPGSAITLKTAQSIVFFGRIAGRWYAVISGVGPRGGPDAEPASRWGNDYSMVGHRLAVWEAGEFRPVSWDIAPSQLGRGNVLPSGFTPELPNWDGKTMTVGDKRGLHLSRHLSAEGVEITRPLRSESR
jgi:hypothetical protein